MAVVLTLAERRAIAEKEARVAANLAAAERKRQEEVAAVIIEKRRQEAIARLKAGYTAKGYVRHWKNGTFCPETERAKIMAWNQVKHNLCLVGIFVGIVIAVFCYARATQCLLVWRHLDYAHAIDVVFSDRCDAAQDIRAFLSHFK